MSKLMQYYDYEYRVRYVDTDKMGVTYYANYFVWFEAARTEYFRALGLPYTECEKKGYYLPVIETAANYRIPSSYDDLVIVRTSISEISRTSIRFEYQVLQKDTGRLLTTGHSVHVFVDKAMRPCRVSEDVKSRVTLHRLLDKLI